jgi:hypothetical protein
MLWTHCRGQASDREEKRNGPGYGECRELQKMKNSGNEAKKYLKTKEITFLSAAICARFACKSAQITA